MPNQVSRVSMIEGNARLPQPIFELGCSGSATTFQNYRERPLQEICAFQWIQSTLEAWQALNRLVARDRFLLLRHEDLMTRPREEYGRILAFCDLPASGYLDSLLEKIRARVFTTGGSKPKPDKWREMHETEILSVSDRIDTVNQLFYP